MPNYNKVQLIGNLTRDPELRYTPRGTAVADLSIAVNRRFGGSDGQPAQEETTYVDVTAWARQAEVAAQYTHKGDSIFIEGRLKLDTWQDAQTGQNRSKLSVVCENLQLLTKPQQQQPQQPQGYRQPPRQQQTAPPHRQNWPPPAQPEPSRGQEATQFPADDDDILF